MLEPSKMIIGSDWLVECFDPAGNLKWTEKNHNLVVNEGLDDVLNKYFKGSSYTATHYIGLKGSGTVVAGDTMASHGGWSELTPYSGNRPTFTAASASSQQLTNSASQATFSITTAASVAGMLLSTSPSAGGTLGILYGAVDFSNVRSVVSGDTLNVTATVSIGGS